MDFQSYRSQLMHGDFSALESAHGLVTAWLDDGAFKDDQDAIEEALSCAAFNGQTELVSLLRAHGAQVDGGQATGMTGLHWASNRGHLHTVRALVDAGADMEVLNNYGGTILGCTVWCLLNQPMPGQIDVVRYLVSAGADRSKAGYPTGNDQLDGILAP